MTNNELLDDEEFPFSAEELRLAMSQAPGAERVLGSATDHAEAIREVRAERAEYHAQLKRGSPLPNGFASSPVWVGPCEELLALLHACSSSLADRVDAFRERERARYRPHRERRLAYEARHLPFEERIVTVAAQLAAEERECEARWAATRLAARDEWRAGTLIGYPRAGT